MPSRKSPQGFKRAVEDRLRQEAKLNGQTLDRLLHVFVMGRFAARILERYPHQVLIKGGYALEIRLNQEQYRARTTKDLDISLYLPANTALELLQEVGQLDLKDFMNFQVSQGSDLTLSGNEYGGTRFAIECLWAGTSCRRFGLDVAFGEPQLQPEQFPAPLLAKWLQSEGVTIPEYRLVSREQHLAEKLHAYTFPRQENSRVRDFPDMGLLIQWELSGDQLLSTITQVFRHRGTHPLPKQLPQASNSWAEPYLRLRKNDPALPWASLAELQQLLSRFWNPLLSEQVLQQHWYPLEQAWLGPTASANNSTNDLEEAT